MILKQLQLHSPLFLGKTNLGDKLDATKKAGLSLEYKPDQQMVEVIFNEETGLIPVTSIACMIPLIPEVVVQKAAPKPRGHVQAQVDSPTGDLTTPGKGRTGQEKSR